MSVMPNRAAQHTAQRSAQHLHVGLFGETKEMRAVSSMLELNSIYVYDKYWLMKGCAWRARNGILNE